MEEQVILAMVQKELGVSILPKLILVNIPDNVHVVDLEKTDYRTLGIAALSLKNTSPAAKKFIDCVLSWLRDHGGLDF